MDRALDPATAHTPEERLQRAQALCVRVEADHAELTRLLRALPAMQRRHDALARYYDAHWLADVQALQAQPDAERRLLDATPDGHYSVLAEDTIWDALSDAREAVQRAIKALARRL